MSSLHVRNAIRSFLDTESTETVVDMTGQFEDVREMLSTSGVAVDAPWLGVEFSTSGEEPVALAADNTQGLYREFGLILLHVCAVAKIGVGASLETRGEALLNLFRGQRIDGIIIERVSPLNTGPGATLEFEAGYVSGTLEVQYYYDRAMGA